MESAQSQFQVGDKIGSRAKSGHELLSQFRDKATSGTKSCRVRNEVAGGMARKLVGDEVS